MELSPHDIRELVHNISSTVTAAAGSDVRFSGADPAGEEGSINYTQFQLVFREPLEDLYEATDEVVAAADAPDDGRAAGASPDEAGDRGFTRVVVQPRPLLNPDEDEDKAGGAKKDKKLVLKDDDPVPESVLDKVTIRVRKVPTLEKIWDTAGLDSRSQVSLWAMPATTVQNSVLTSKKSLVVNLGHYVAPGKSVDGKTSRLTLEISYKGRTGDFERILRELLPHPIKFDEVWKHGDGETGVWTWEGVSPDPMFTCLGSVTTSTAAEPDVRCVRCVPKKWLMPSQATPKRYWDDSGTGGKKGSFWVMSESGLLTVVAGHEKPQGIFYDLWKKSFKASEGLF